MPRGVGFFLGGFFYGGFGGRGGKGFWVGVCVFDHVRVRF